jgi:type I restriction enzyme, S subunit
MRRYSGPLRGVCEGIFDGPHATPKESTDGPIFLGIANVTPDGKLDLSDIRHVSEQEFPRWTRRVTPRPGDIVFSYEATLHRYAVIPQEFRGCLGRRMGLVRVDPKKANARFLHYYFLSRNWRTVVESSIITGATVDRIPLTRFPDFPIDIPLTKEQNRITEILSAYDDLIENNKRRTKLIDDTVQLLHREWFVYCRFPGYEHKPLLDGLPQGWTRKALRELCKSVDYGYTASASADPVGPKFLRITDIVPDQIDWSSVPYCIVDEAHLQRFLLAEGDIVVARTGATVGYAKRLHKRFPRSLAVWICILSGTGGVKE